MDDDKSSYLVKDQILKFLLRPEPSASLNTSDTETIARRLQLPRIFIYVLVLELEKEEMARTIEIATKHFAEGFEKECLVILEAKGIV